MIIINLQHLQVNKQLRRYSVYRSCIKIQENENITKAKQQKLAMEENTGGIRRDAQKVRKSNEVQKENEVHERKKTTLEKKMRQKKVVKKRMKNRDIEECTKE